MSSLLLTRGLSFACRAIFLGTHIVAVGFVARLLVPRASDTVPSSTDLVIDALLLLAFALQFAMTRSAPDLRPWLAASIDLPVSRSMQLLSMTRALVATMMFWRPLDAVVWSVPSPLLATVLLAVCAGGAALALTSRLGTGHARLRCYAGCVVALWAAPVMTVGHALVAMAATIAFVAWWVRLDAGCRSISLRAR